MKPKIKLKTQKNTSDPKMSVESLKLPTEPSLIGTYKEKLTVSELKEDTDDSYYPKSSPKREKTNQNTGNVTSATVESQLLLKGKTWKDKLSTSELNTLTTKLLRTLDQASISKERVLTPFWTQQSEEISERLWLPTKIDCVDSVLNSSTESLQNTLMGQSWFSINKKHPQKKNSSMTSFQLSQFSLPDSMDSEVTPSNEKSKQKLLRTLKIRLFPTTEEKTQIQTLLDQYRWYYNITLNIVYNHYGHDKITNERKYSAYTVRDLVRKYEYTEETHDNLLFKDIVYDENRDEIPVPEWWDGKVHSRLPRGASNKFVSSLNSAISNHNNGNTKHFRMKFMSKKKNTEYLNFEDKNFPAFIRKIKSNYWFANTQGKRTKISFSDIDTQKRGIEIIYEKTTGKYFLHYPVERTWFPTEDRRNDSQAKFVSVGDRIISLDPGIRKFLVGYDPTGYSIFIGEGAQTTLIELLLRIDKTEDKVKRIKIWKQVKNLVNELHWKTISFLMENYDVILLPDFRVSQMIRKKKLGKMTKRLMCMFSFFSFKEKLKFKCATYGKKLIIVDESYTSCTCGRCGKINDVQGKEVFHCRFCGLEVDRDATGSRNIFIKNVSLR